MDLKQASLKDNSESVQGWEAKKTLVSISTCWSQGFAYILANNPHTSTRYDDEPYFGKWGLGELGSPMAPRFRGRARLVI